MLVSLENVQFDMNELEKGMRNTKKEFEIRLESKVNQIKTKKKVNLVLIRFDKTYRQ